MIISVGALIGLGVMALLIIVILVWARKEIKENNGFRK